MFRVRRLRWAFSGAVAAAAGIAVIVVVVADGGGGVALSDKDQFIANEAGRIAAAQAAPQAVKPLDTPDLSAVNPSAPPCASPVSLPFPTSGILNGGQGGPFGSAANFDAISSWAGSVAGSSSTYAIWSGSTGTPTGAPGVPAVDVYLQSVTPDGCSVADAGVGIFQDPNANGPLVIDGVNGAWLVLTTPTGESVAFNVLTDQFQWPVPV